MANLLGNNLVVRLGSNASGDVIMCATSCSLNINQNATEASCKGDPDSSPSKWSSSIAGTASWDISTDNLYDPTMANNSFDALAKKIIDDANGTTDNSFPIAFQVINDSSVAGDVEYYTGTVMLTDVSVNGPVDEFATYTANFKGIGALTQASKSA